MKSTLIWMALALSTLALDASAQVTVKDPWVRATVAGQKVSGAFMEITTAKGGRLVAVSSPAAGTVEIHEMAMVGDLMKMRPVEALDLPAGKAVSLKPGGYHVMLFDLKQALKPGDKLPLSLVIEGPDRQRESVAVSATVKGMGNMPAHSGQ